MATSVKTPLMQKIIFVAVLIIGAIIWKFGADYFVKSKPDADAEQPYEVEEMHVKPL